jgi:putative tryptophan/tyrosine transport system substrate-binding protein
VLGLLAAATSAHAQSKMPRLGILLTGSSSSAAQAPQLDALMKSLTELGWIEGQNLAVDRRWAEQPEQLAGLATELAQSSVSVILALGPEATRVAVAATPTTPVVMIASTDPRLVGASSLARPGGNLTGLTVGEVEVFFEKQLDLLKAAIPGLARVVVAWDVNRLRDRGDRAVVMADPARALSLQLQHVDIGRIRDFEGAFKTARSVRAGAVLIIAGPRAVENRSLIAEVALKSRMPLMSQFSQMAEAGALLSYGPDLNDLFRRAGSYVHRILKGARPGDLPIEQPSKYELVLNLRTAKALSLSIPHSLVLRADQVIE